MIEGTAVDLDAGGALIVNLIDGSVRKVLSGDVIRVIQMGLPGHDGN
jgi:hypothetical protein